MKTRRFLFFSSFESTIMRIWRPSTQHDWASWLVHLFVLHVRSKLAVLLLLLLLAFAYASFENMLCMLFPMHGSKWFSEEPNADRISLRIMHEYSPQNSLVRQSLNEELCALSRVHCTSMRSRSLWTANIEIQAAHIVVSSDVSTVQYGGMVHFI